MAEIKWFKLSTTMFDDDNIKLIESLPDHDSILIIWIKLLAQAGKCNASGYLILNNKIPYTDEMLASIFRRPINTVRLALNTFKKFGMIEFEDDLFKNVDDKATDATAPAFEQDCELSNRRMIEELVIDYNRTLDVGRATIIDYYRNYKKIGKYLWLNSNEGDDVNPKEDITPKMQMHLNSLVAKLREDYWRRVLDLPEVRKRMTEKRRQEFEDKVQKGCDLDFTESNIRQFVLNLIAGYQKTLTDAVLEIFDLFTIRHCWSNGLYDENIHLFNGWKTNKAFKVGKRVIIPLYGGYGDGAFRSWGKWKLHWDADKKLRDIDVVMNYFDGMDGYLSISRALEAAFDQGQSRKIESTYFTITVYMKGTIHLEFKDENILRRFNVAACLGKNWLPDDYGKKHYKDCADEEKTVIESFEGIESYAKNINQPVFANHGQLMLSC
jgi:predicted phage replisome organizer